TLVRFYLLTAPAFFDLNFYIILYFQKPTTRGCGVGTEKRLPLSIGHQIIHSITDGNWVWGMVNRVAGVASH
ncbi:MAG: hypothetical protein ACHRXM_12380, partial [Isosphaerales bacterium]